MKSLIISSIALLLAGGLTALAQNQPLVDGKITKIDASAGKITIDHQKIPNLDMPPMTMVFKTSSPDQLKIVKVGDKVRFSADSVNGQMTVVRIQKAK